MPQLASGKKCSKIALVCPKLGLVSEVWKKYGTCTVTKSVLGCSDFDLFMTTYLNLA